MTWCARELVQLSALYAEGWDSIPSTTCSPSTDGSDLKQRTGKTEHLSIAPKQNKNNSFTSPECYQYTI